MCTVKDIVLTQIILPITANHQLILQLISHSLTEIKLILVLYSICIYLFLYRSLFLFYYCFIDWQFSVDELTLREAYTLFFFIYLLLLPISIYISYNLHKLVLFHITVQMMLVGVTSTFISVTFYMIHYLIFTSDGIGCNSCKSVGYFFALISEVNTIYINNNILWLNNIIFYPFFVQFYFSNSYLDFYYHADYAIR